ncbi:hypothetical protein KY333_04505, partial [Candidatus Woesearchaeota archaeon]|nr:hypothetical protein [Candidatus Woesearchaeota archaeon]
MIDLKNHKAAWVQEKVKDLEYLESIDYANLNKLVDDAYASGSAKKIVEAHWEIKKYAPGILKDRSSQIPLKQVDTEIDRLVSTYADIKTRLDKKIITHKAARQNQFHKNYDSNTPNITTLRQISEDYASFQGTIPNLDETILQYAGFDQAWTAVESRVGKATKAYISIKNNKGIKKIQEEIKTCKTALDKTQKQAPKKFLRGIHKAYRYQNAKLVQLDAEVQRFEKEDFAKRRTSAERKIAIASDFINFLQEVDLNDIAPVLREYTQQDFAFDFNGVKNTLYFGSLPQDYAIATQ